MAVSEVGNKQVIFKGYIDGIPKETDMELNFSNNIQFNQQLPSQALLVKNLYLSCDPYMRGRMRDFHGSYIPPFLPSKVCIHQPLSLNLLYVNWCLNNRNIMKWYQTYTNLTD